MHNQDVYKNLADCLDALPNGFPASETGAELRLLQKLFSPEEAAIASKLRLEKETAEQIAARLGMDSKMLRQQLKSMTKKGLIAAGSIEGGLGFGLLPFVVGIYEMQFNSMDEEMARLFEEYYQQVYKEMLTVSPPVHRVIPVYESIRMDIEIQPYESVVNIIDGMKSWGVIDCICRKQKALIGDACHHPVDVCMVLSERSDMFANSTAVRALNRQEAMETLQRAEKAGLVHTVTNSQKGVWYICNCCMCSCAILRGMAEKGLANVVAHSAYVNQVDETLCIGCGDCIEYCQFGALSVGSIAEVNKMRCVGCGLCVAACPEEALILVERPPAERKPPPLTEDAWLFQRAKARGIPWIE
jgi:electron transport complex protein RnfB